MTPQSPGRLGLSPTMRTFAFVDAILVLTFFVLLIVTGTGGGGSHAEEPRPGASVSDEVTPEASPPASPTDAKTLTSFVLPSRNIWCEMTETSATCTILRYTFTSPNVPKGCDGSVGNVVEISAGNSARMACVHGTSAPAPSGAKVLAYGQASTVGEMTCHSSTNGATCRHNPTGKGFSLARGGYTFF
jgi:hypothetical protein